MKEVERDWEMEEEEWEEPELEEEERELVTDADVLAAEALTNRRLLTLLLMLASGPKYASSIAEVIPHSTAHRLLRKLEELGVVASYKGVDGRRRYYKLTERGEAVLNNVTRVLRNYVAKLFRKYGKRVSSGYILEPGLLKKAVEEQLGVPLSLIVGFLGLSVYKYYGEEVYLLEER
ncbi:MAG: hypothetical protein DRJ96_06560 [Thermoprotei archaeon]|nr:MAG: hypothetical protein DRJ67_06615 [Thermoprotei archaeon]RLE96451.1 MAG: hypothetical protein DRJ96_06560 [Thermoprotei archaeon]